MFTASAKDLKSHATNSNVHCAIEPSKNEPHSNVTSTQRCTRTASRWWWTTNRHPLMNFSLTFVEFIDRTTLKNKNKEFLTVSTLVHSCLKKVHKKLKISEVEKQWIKSFYFISFHLQHHHLATKAFPWNAVKLVMKNKTRTLCFLLLFIPRHLTFEGVEISSHFRRSCVWMWANK